MRTERRTLPPMLRVVEDNSLVARLYPLSNGRTVIGRSPGCDIVLSPRTVSKIHAEIREEAGGLVLKNHSRKAGVLVLGRKIDAPVVLKDGTKFRVAGFDITFQAAMETIGEEECESTVLASSDSVSLQRSEANLSFEQTLRVILEISRELGRALRLDEVLERTLDSLFRLFPQVERGQIFLQAGPGQEMLPRALRTRSKDASVPVVSRAILEKILADREAVLCEDAVVEFPESLSIFGNQVRSLLCAPLLDASQRSIGMIQLDASRDRGLFRKGDLEVLAAVAGQVGLAVENARLHEVALRDAEHESELFWARRIMMSLLPERDCVPSGHESWSCYLPARKVGGDYLGAFPMPEHDGTVHRCAFAVGDVVGKGLPAAIFLARLSAEVRVVMEADDDPAAILALLNENLAGVGPAEMFVTFLLAFLDTRTHRLTFASAGHPVPRIYRAASGVVETIGEDANGLPLAIEGGSTYQSFSTTIEPGDVIVMFTDGVHESSDLAHRPIGLPEIERVIAASPDHAREVGEAILNAIRNHAGPQPQSDDIAILCLRRMEEFHE